MPDDDAEFRRRRRQRNVALGVILLAFAALFYAITLVKIAE